jgi:hypothetical protein
MSRRNLPIASRASMSSSAWWWCVNLQEVAAAG